MAKKIALIGAGSFGFTRILVKDILTYDATRDAELWLMDIDKPRLEWIARACRLIVEKGGYPAKVHATMDRTAALKGAHGVVCTILAGDINVWQHDILIPKKYGVDTNVGDTRGPSGIFRMLRTLPVMLDICRDIGRHAASDALFLNYTNPMAMLCHGMQKTTRVNVTGLCHSVQGTAHMLAGWLNKPVDELTYVCAGINHLAWYLKLEHRGRDLYPALRKAVSENPKIYNAERVRNELFLAFDRYVTESSGHNSEYNPWFRKRPDLIKKYCSPAKGANWNPGEYAYSLELRRKRKHTWRNEIRQWLADAEAGKLDLKRGHEYASSIFNAYFGGDAFTFNGNVPNRGAVENLPRDCCVEVPVLASRGQLQAVRVGPLPPACAVITSQQAQIETLAVDSCLAGDPLGVYQAIANDPLTAAVLSLAEIRKMTREMFDRNKKNLPTFKNVKI